jgi:hypothetical protein
MHKPTQVPNTEPETKNGDTGPEAYDNDLIMHFEKRLGQILRAGRTRKRARREQNDKSNGVGGND